jgi:nucleoid-associated protein YgaU
MIYSDSRYADGRVFKAYDSRTGKAQITVLRTYPNLQNEFYSYVWKENDRIDVLAQKLYGSSDEWTKIMDYNPEIVDPSSIYPGTSIRIPNG